MASALGFCTTVSITQTKPTRMDLLRPYLQDLSASAVETVNQKLLSVEGLRGSLSRFPEMEPG